MHVCDMHTNRVTRCCSYQTSFRSLKVIDEPHYFHASTLLSSLVASIILLDFVDRAMEK